MTRGSFQKNRRKKHYLLYGIYGLVFLCLAFFGVIVLVPALSPASGAQVADLLRPVVGPQPVAVLETISFRIKDSINQFISFRNGGKVQISVHEPINIQRLMTVRKRPPAGAVTSAPPQTVTASQTPDVVSALPQIGWQAYGPTANGSPLMAQTLLTLDPQRPYAAIALVRMDLSRLKLHMMPGSLEPSHAALVVDAIPNLGMIPLADQRNLIAAFNGGFKAINGHYGMMVNYVPVLPPQPGLATLAIYQDGHVNIGAWEGGISPTPDLIAFRQNCPLIVQNGQVNQMVNVTNFVMWGSTIGNQDITWRTGVGITQDSRYLIYAVGNGTSIGTLAEALLKAGAYNAMQLDINSHYAHFVTYQPTGNPGRPLAAVQLLDQMEKNPSLYLKPNTRDYFYLTTH